MRTQKITKIENAGVYGAFDWNSSFSNVGQSEQNLNKINVFYGRNYSGKTTLSRIFRAIEKNSLPKGLESSYFELLLDDNTILNSNQIGTFDHVVRVFNSDYRKENLAFLSDTSQDGEIKSFAVIGAENVQINEKIRVLENSLGSDLAGSESGLYEEKRKIRADLAESRQNYESKLKKLENKKHEKATTSTSSIKKQVNLYGKVTYNVNSLDADIKTVQADTYQPISEQEKSEALSCVKEEKKEYLHRIVPLDNDFLQLVDRAKSLVEQEIGNTGKIVELLRRPLLEAWVRQGKQFHEQDNASICHYCGNVISSERWNQLRAHFDDASEILRKKIDSLLCEIDAYQTRISIIINSSPGKFYFSLQSIESSLVMRYEQIRELFCSSLSSLTSQLKYKLDNLTTVHQFTVPEDYTNNLNEIIKEYNNLIDKSNSITQVKEESIGEAQEKLRLREIYDFLIAIDYNSLTQDISKAKECFETKTQMLDNINERIDTVKKSINDLRKQLHDVSRGAEYINAQLSLLDGLRLKLVPKNSIQNKQVYFDVERNGVPARNLSEGECSIIAFCYFMARLDDADTQNSSPLIFIDDPVCSLDANHIFFVYSQIRAHIIERKRFSQLFISTHNLDFLKYLKRLTKKQPNNDRYEIAWFIIERLGNSSRIIAMPRYMREHVTEFEYLFSQIYSCAKSQYEDDSNYNCFYNFGNNARKFLELYTYFKRPNEKSDAVMAEIFGNRVYSLLIDRVNNELSHLMGNLERGASTIDYSEIKMVANLILNAIKQQDEKQYSSLLASIGVSESE